MKYHLEEEAIQERNPRLYRILKDYGFHDGPIVVDIGGGAGQTLRLLKNKKLTKIAIDIDDDALKMGASISINREDGTRYVKSTAEILPLKSSSVSHVICRVTLNYLNMEKASGELTRILSNGGVAFLKVESFGFDIGLIKNAQTIKDRLVRLYEMLCGIVFNVFGKQVSVIPGIKAGRLFYTESSLRKLVRKNGMHIKSLKCIGSEMSFPKSIEAIVEKLA